MSVKERSKKWHYRFVIDGHVWSGSTGLAATTRNLKPAERIELEARQMVEQGRGHLLKIPLIPFIDGSERFLLWCQTNHARKPRTYQRIRCSFSTLNLFFNKRTVSTITEGDVIDFVTWRRDKYAVKDVTIRHDLHALSKFFRFGLKHNWVRKNPVKAEDIPSDAEAIRVNPLSLEQEARYFHAAERYPNLYDLCRLMILQGCRPEELLSLRPKQVDLERGYIQILDGKTKAAKRKLKLDQESITILSRRLAGEWVFPAVKDATKKLALITLHKAHRKVVAASGVQCVPYDLRHTFATRKASAGCSLPTLAAVLGHSSIHYIMKYVHVSQEDMDKAMGSPTALPQPEAERITKQ